MARTSGKKAAKKVGRPKKASVAEAKREQPVDLQALRAQIAQVVVAQMETMTEAISDEAAKGHLAQFKYLLELIGLYPAAPEAKQELHDSDDLAAELLKHLDFPNREIEEEEKKVANGELVGDSVE